MVKSNSTGAIGMILIVLVVIGVSMLAMTTTMMNANINANMNKSKDDKQNIVVNVSNDTPPRSIYEDRNWLAHAPRYPFWFNTRGPPAKFRQVGVLIHNNDGQDNPKHLPLIGRPIYPGAHK